MLEDGKYRVPRIWSNKELAKISHLFSGKIINVSGWQDQDKQGRRYKEYFKNLTEYFVSNIEGGKGLCGLENEIYLDLEKDISPEFKKKFDVVFNHTTLEHVYTASRAFDNLCLLSKDVVILIVPFLQEQHDAGFYGDYWRFTPQGIARNFKERGFDVLYISSTPFKNNSVYIFAVATCNFEKWKDNFKPLLICDGVIKNFGSANIFCKIAQKIKNLFL